MVTVRVYELAKEFGVESKVVMARLQEMGEFVRSASSILDPVIVRRLKESFHSGGQVETIRSANHWATARRGGATASRPQSIDANYRRSPQPGAELIGQRRAHAGYAFISYVREDARQADQLQRDLLAAGVSVWHDSVELWPGEDWRMKIRNAITGGEALVFVACFSSRSTARTTSYQNEELTLAIEQMRLRRPGEPWLIPVRLDECDVPDVDLGGGRTLASIHRADLFGDQYERNLVRLIATVQRILMASPTNEPPPQ